MRDELVATLERLLERRDKFDYIIVECTGLANPGKLASSFWLDDDLESKMYLDAIVTVVDAKNIEKHLNVIGSHENPEGPEPNEANVQVAYADVILLNKTDLVQKKDITRIRSKLSKINPDAKVVLTEKARIDLDDILLLKAFDRAQIASRIEATMRYSDMKTATSTTSGHVELKSVTSVCLREKGVVDRRKFELWMANLLWEEEEARNATASSTESRAKSPRMDIFRAKGVLNIHESDQYHILQVVHELFECEAAGAWDKEDDRVNKLIFIGRNLSRDRLLKGYRSTLVTRASHGETASAHRHACVDSGGCDGSKSAEAHEGACCHGHSEE